MVKKIDDIWSFKRPAVAVDVVLFSIIDDELMVGLIKREDEPYFGKYSLPGRFVRYDEPTRETAKMALKLKGGFDPTDIYLKQLHTFGNNLKRDTRIRTISIIYFGLINSELINLNKKGTFEWHHVYDLPRLAFDHKEIVDFGVRHIRTRIWEKDIAYQLMPKEFTLSDLQKAYESILGKEIDKRNFRKKIFELDILKDLKKKRMDGAHRPALVYSFKHMK